MGEKEEMKQLLETIATGFADMKAEKAKEKLREEIKEREKEEREKIWVKKPKKSYVWIISLTALLFTVGMSALGSYGGRVKADSDVINSIDQLTSKVESLESTITTKLPIVTFNRIQLEHLKMINARLKISDYNNHCVQDNYNFLILGNHAGISLIKHEKVEGED